MKNLFILLLMATALTAACTDSSTNEQTQDYTSIVITATIDRDFEITEIVSGYYDADGVCRKIAEHGDLAAQANKKVSTKPFILPDTCPADTIYLFCSTISLFDNQNREAYRWEYPFKSQKNIQNILDISVADVITKGMLELLKDDAKYPH